MRALILILMLTTPVHAQEPPPSIVKPPPKPPGKYFVYLGAAVPVYTYMAPKAMAPEAHVTPANRAIFGQQIGFGYFVHPMVRIMLTVQFAEYLTNAPAGASSFALLGFIPWVVFTHKGFFTGAGPMLAPISYGKAPNFDAGIFTATGYSFALGKGVGLAPTLQIIAMLNQRSSVQIAPAISLSYRF
jgi:hypothetical protein